MRLQSLCLSMALMLGLVPVAGGLTRAQDEPKDEPKEEQKDEPARDQAGAPRPTPRPAGRTRPYDRVITKDAKTSVGLFLVHRLDDKVFFEIPSDELGKEMLWVTQLAQTQAGFGFGGQEVSDRVVRWEQRGEDILLREVKYRIRADIDDPIQDAVRATSVEPIISVFAIQAYGKDKRPVIDVTSLYTSDLPEFSARDRVRASGADPRRSFIEKVLAFPTNIEAEVLMTYRGRAGGAGGPGGPGGPPSGGGDAGSAITVVLRHSMVKLPDDPMKPRRHDDRVGFFRVSFENYGNLDKQEVERVSYITRWRLEKKDPKEEVSEPKKPIVYYIGREVPSKWRPYVKKGVEAWSPAFEKAGFKNAVQAKEPPDVREDPDWDAEDARYSSVRWLPSTTENAYGPHVHDPRTGEILDSDIRMYHNVLKLARDWYFVQASPNDEKAQKLPLSDDLLGELLAYVVTHEVGHTLGFPHNMKASSSYTVEQLRDPEFTKQFGVEASIMDYGRFNYVAQPGDGARLIPIVGPYDEFAVEWGYREFPDAKTYEDEKKELEKIVARQKDDPRLLFGDPNPSEDPSQQTEDLGSDPIEATRLGLQNIDRVAGYLVDATTTEGENYDLLRTMYGQLVGQRNRELGHVANVVGGVVAKNFWDAERVFEVVPAERQKAAVAFLIEHAFGTPEALVNPEITDRLGATGAADRILSSQRSILSSLLNNTRLRRMSELAHRNGEESYAPLDLMNDLHAGIWSELKDEETVSIDLYRRNLQRAYVDTLAPALDNPSTNSDLPALARVSLEKVLEEVKGALGAEKEIDKLTRAHLEDIKSRVEQALDPIPSAMASRAETEIPSPRRGPSEFEEQD